MINYVFNSVASITLGLILTILTFKDEFANLLKRIRGFLGMRRITGEIKNENRDYRWREL